MALPDPTKRKASFARKSKPAADAAAAEPAPAERASAHSGVQFGPTKSAPGSRLKGGK
jgi:hypothetical protein